MADTPRGETTAETLKRRALIRLAVAGAITVAALAGLWWLDKSGRPAPERKPAPPAPIVTAPEPAPPPAPVLTEPSPPVGVGAAQPEPPAAPPPPPRVSNLSAAPSAGAPAAAVPGPVPKLESQAQPAPPPPAPAPLPVARGFLLQLGVFSNPDNAKQLVERLNREGIRAYSETRVQVGPFQTREEAEKARLALERLGIKAVIAPLAATR